MGDAAKWHLPFAFMGVLLKLLLHRLLCCGTFVIQYQSRCAHMQKILSAKIMENCRKAILHNFFDDWCDNVLP